MTSTRCGPPRPAPGARAPSAAGVRRPLTRNPCRDRDAARRSGRDRLWVAVRGADARHVAIPLAVFLLVVGRGRRAQVVVQLGPRSWYTASTPVVVLAALLGGPLLGVAAGVSTQLDPLGSRVATQCGRGRRRRAAGSRGRDRRGSALLAARRQTRVSRRGAAAMAAAVVVNSVGRLFVMPGAAPEAPARALAGGVSASTSSRRCSSRRCSPCSSSPQRRAAPLVATTVGSLLAVLLIAQRSRAIDGCRARGRAGERTP